MIYDGTSSGFLFMLISFLLTLGVDKFIYRNSYTGLEVVMWVFNIYSVRSAKGDPEAFRSNVLSKVLSYVDLKRLAGDFRYSCNIILFIILVCLLVRY